MILKVFTFAIASLMSCFSNIACSNGKSLDARSGLTSSIRPISPHWVISNFDTGLSKQLAKDHQRISEFSKKMKSFEVDQTHFNILFQEGLKKSILFHYTSNIVAQSELNRFIKTQLINHPLLKHPLKTPAKNTSNSDKSFDVLNTFSGKWFGKWESMDVQHLWLPIRKCAIRFDKEHMLIGFQTCFTGDGFGWNYLIRKGEEISIIGHVYHFNKKGTIAYENPHYAFLNNQNQLTWVSNNHVYYEFVCYRHTCAQKKHYVISAIPYSNINELIFGSPIQAIYVSANSSNDF